MFIMGKLINRWGFQSYYESIMRACYMNHVKLIISKWPFLKRSIGTIQKYLQDCIVDCRIDQSVLSNIFKRFIFKPIYKSCNMENTLICVIFFVGIAGSIRVPENLVQLQITLIFLVLLLLTALVWVLIQMQNYSSNSVLNWRQPVLRL